MDLIKGTEITLYSYAGGELISEKISDVLIGEKTGSSPNETTDGRLLGYTIAIPKGDTHNWTDRMVGFFGMFFRTVGYPEQGIEENIPLRWHKKIKVELMDIAGTCTVYDTKTYTRHLFDRVCIRDTRGGMLVSADGSRVSGELQVCIYAPFKSDAYVPRPNDIIVPCECPITFDTSSEESVSQNMAALRRDFPSVAGIIRTSQLLFGSQPDTLITAR